MLERQLKVVATKDLTISDLLAADPPQETKLNDFHLELRKDIKQTCEYLEDVILPECDKEVKKITTLILLIMFCNP